MKALILFMFTVIPLFLGSSIAIASSGVGVTYHGRLVDPTGAPVVASSVQFRLQIKTPGTENCLMYEEIQSKDMSASNGVFAVTINDGTGSRQDSSGFSLDQIFANRSNFTFPGGYCASGTAYLPNSSDGRALAVYFNDGTFSGWEPVPSQAINFVPMAIESMQVGGYKKENLVKVASGVDTTGSDLTGANFTELMALLNGTSTQFVKPGAATFTAAPQWAGVPAGGNDLANKTYVDAQVAAGLPNFGTAGTYTKITTDVKGRVSGGTTLSASDIPALDAAKITTGVLPIANGGTNSSAALVGSKVMVSSGTAIVEGVSSNTAKSNNTFVMRDGSGNIAGALGTFDSLSVLLGGTLTLNGATSGSVAIVSPMAPTSYTLTLPTTGGTNGYVLSTNGSGVTSWVPLSATTPLSGLTAATGASSIDNLTFGQTWNWSTATTQSPMTVTANALTTGSLLNLTTSSASINSTNGLLNVANSSATTTGTLARFQANSTAGSGMTILNSGNVGVGISSPSFPAEVYSGTGGSFAATSTGVTYAAPYSAVEHSQGRGYSGTITGVSPMGADTLAPFHSVSTTNTHGASNMYGIILEGSYSPSNGWNSASPGALANGDYLPGVAFAGQSNTVGGSGMLIGAAINGVVNGTVASGILPTDLVFRTSTTNSTGLMERVRITSAGNVGIGTASPAATSKLEVVGAATSRTNIITSGATVNLSLGNQHYLKAPGGSAITLQNMSDGGVYTMVIYDTTSRTYTFSGCTNSYFSPTNGPTTNYSTYTVLVVVDGANTNCFITWITGFN